MRKADEKAARKEEERAAKEKRKSTPSEGAVIPTTETDTEPVGTTTTITAGSPSEESAPTTTETHEAATSPAVAPTPAAIRTSMEDQASLRMRENAEAANADESTSPSSPKKKSWLRSKFSRRMSKGSKSSSDQKEKGKEETSSFVGGAALTGAGMNTSTASDPASGSMRDVALAKPDLGPDFGKTVTEEPVSEAGPSMSRTMTESEEGERVGRAKSRGSAVSSLSDASGTANEEFQEARDNFDEDLIPPPTFAAEKNSSPVRDSKFKEVI
jgi:hypothetical protein